MFLLITLIFIIIFNNVCCIDNSVNFISQNLTVEQIKFFNRVQGAAYIPNPYNHLSLSQVCIGTSNHLSSSENDYQLWKTTYQNCVYLDGNLEISNFRPENDNEIYDFSFLHNITEITGYLLVFNSEIEYLPLPNLKVIRGWKVFNGKSVFIQSNSLLKYLDLRNLKEIQNGSVVIEENANLCYANTIDWSDIISKKEDLQTSSIALTNEKCKFCNRTCCNNKNECSCWERNICQTLTKSICHPICPGRCFGPSADQCCRAQCAAGCTGPTEKDCLACQRFRIHESGVCVDYCERKQIADPLSGALQENPNGMYQFSIACVKFCPERTVVYQDYCLRKCPKDTYEVEEAYNSTHTQKKCLLCTQETCPIKCSLETDDAYLTKDNIHLLKDCQEFTGNMRILETFDSTEPAYSEEDLENLSSLRTINGYLFVQTKFFKNLNFLRNLELIRGRSLFSGTYGMAINGENLKTLNLKNLKKVENGMIVIKAKTLCLHDTINWNAISPLRTQTTEFNTKACAKEGYVCDKMCQGCWSTDNNMCQFCKNYKLNDACVDDCNNVTINGTSLYVSDNNNRVCDYCHHECNSGCIGPTDYECKECQNAYLYVNQTHKRCVKECPVTHFKNETTKQCMPCYQNCEGCKGPEKTVSPAGCISCIKGVVDNDQDYTVLECNGDSDCYPNYYETTIPKELIKHPLQKKIVCRKCHSECESCNGDGDTNCKKCKNYYSTQHKKCVSECLKDEYLDKATNTCLPCNPQCSNGCHGLSSYECNECKSYKLLYEHGSKIKALINETNSKKHKREVDKQIFFCVERCPEEYPHYTAESICTDKDANSNSTLLWILCLCIGFLTVIIGFAFFFWCRYKIEQEKRRKQERFINGYDVNDVGQLCYQPNLSQLKLLKEEDFRKLELLGKGAFGCVFKGIWQPDNVKFQLEVAIKELNSELEKSEELIDEAKIMASVRHPHCLRLIALCMAKPVMIVTPLLEYGSTLNYFQKHKEQVTEKMLLIWCSQIAEGMNYLESREIVHRDLAARNVLVQSPAHVRITDFGLAKVLDNGSSEFYGESGTLMPIKWLAPECIIDRLYSHKSDVWSYGVTCWELFTFGAKPFEDIPVKHIYLHVKSGIRLPQPQMTTIDVYMQLMKCWISEPNARPTFEKLQQIFSKMSQEPRKYLQINQKCFDQPFMTTKPNIVELMRELSHESQLTNGIEYDDGIELDSTNTTPNTVNQNNFSTNENGEDSAFLGVTDGDCRNYSTNRYYSDPLNIKMKSNQLLNSKISTPKKRSNIQPNERHDSAFFSTQCDDIDEERLLRISNGTSSNSSNKFSSNTSESETSNDSLTVIAEQESIDKNTKKNLKNFEKRSLQPNLKMTDNPIYNKMTNQDIINEMNKITALKFLKSNNLNKPMRTPATLTVPTEL